MDEAARFLHDLNNEQKRIARTCWPYILGFFALLTGPYVYLDLFHWDANGAYVWMGFLQWALGYLFLIGAMQKTGYFAGGKKSGVGTYFALGIVTGLAIGSALIAFVIPGLYLVMRWLPAYARALTNEGFISETLRWSWRATERFQRPLAIALLGPIVLYGISVVSTYSDELGISIPYEVAIIIAEVSQSAGSAWLTILGIAVYGSLSQERIRAVTSQDLMKPA